MCPRLKFPVSRPTRVKGLIHIGKFLPAVQHMRRTRGSHILLLGFVSHSDRWITSTHRLPHVNHPAGGYIDAILG